jgi:hypothetical protein
VRVTSLNRSQRTGKICGARCFHAERTAVMHHEPPIECRNPATIYVDGLYRCRTHAGMYVLDALLDEQEGSAE